MAIPVIGQANPGYDLAGGGLSPLGWGYAPAGSGGDYAWAVDPASYGAGFTNLNAGLNTLQQGTFSGMTAEGRTMLSEALGRMPTTLDMTGINRFIGDQTGGLQAWDQSLLGGYVGRGGGIGDSIMNQFLGRMPAIQGLISGATSPFETGLRESLRRMTGEVTSEVASEMAGMGALYSGATEDFIGKRMGTAEENAMTQLSQLQAQLMGQLGGGALSAITSGAGMGLEGLLAGLGTSFGTAQANLQGGQYAANAGINAGLGLTGIGATGLSSINPEWVAPDITFRPTWWQSWGAPTSRDTASLAAKLIPLLV